MTYSWLAMSTHKITLAYGESPSWIETPIGRQSPYYLLQYVDKCHHISQHGFQRCLPCAEVSHHRRLVLVLALCAP